MSTKGKLVLILGPSGSGKGTLIKELKKKHPEFIYPISMTSRPKRKGEQDGDVYYFISKDEFEKKIDQNEFLEWAVVHQNSYYGTLKKPILEAVQSGNIVIREVDIQGFELICEILPKEDLVSIFIMPDSLENLVERIQKRSQMSVDEIKRRVESAKNEIERSDECDYIIKNSDGYLSESLKEIEWILEHETQL